jgi:hypothetical protein
MEHAMTMPLRGTHVRRRTGATNFNIRQMSMTILKAAAIAAGLAATVIAILAIRVYVYVPALP